MLIGTIGCTHGNLPPTSDWPELDVFVHLGDFAPSFGSQMEDPKQDGQLQLDWFYKTAAPWLAGIKARNKVVVGGNHDRFIQYNAINFQRFADKNGFYLALNNNLVFDDRKFYFSCVTVLPAELELSRPDWCFGRSETLIGKSISLADDETEFLFTHSPQYGVLDYGWCRTTNSPLHLGSKAIAARVLSLPKLKLHVCSHEHYCGGKQIDLPGLIVANSAQHFMAFAV